MRIHGQCVLLLYHEANQTVPLFQQEPALNSVVGNRLLTESQALLRGSYLNHSVTESQPPH